MEHVLDPLNSFIIIVIVGSLFLLSFLLIVNLLKVNRKANILLACFLLIWGSFWTDELFGLIGIKSYSPFFIEALHVIQTFCAVLFYYSVLYFTNPYRKLKRADLFHLIVPIIVTIAYTSNIEIEEGLNPNHLFAVLLLIQASFYILASLQLLHKHEKRIELFNSNRELVDLKWIKQIIHSLVAISIFIIVYNLIESEGNLNIVGNGFSLMILLYLAYNTLKQKEIFLISEEELEKVLEEKDKEQKTKQKLLSDKEIIVLSDKLEILMKDEKPYLEGDLSLSKLADLLKITPHHLSYLLNEGFNKNFFQFVNYYRVEEAKSLLLSEAYKNISIIGIAYDSGFNSKTAFNTVFKKQTGMTPSLFKKVSNSNL
ncbi:helix-turn-helix domain-containing protein [Marinifilum sp. N1E240]|uniref:helix-turn-helix domain-containing protein n=1 Tax=Marinifilum sp. N1E240 TaxID=2608082 RepID=UPI00128D7927|nr:AraC family transcriptional regulator [Marinifilum sp. N1E240]MPQ48973.1 helix-turn-helix domain-containing protein [Marinifilum sp. N1E240]